MDHALIIEQLIERGTGVMEQMLQAADRHSVAAASRAILAHLRDVTRAVLPATVELEAQPGRQPTVPPGCPEAEVTDVHTRTVRPSTRCGAMTSPVRTFRCPGGETARRPDDAVLGVPERGGCTAAVRVLSTPLGAAWPPRVANDRRRRVTGLAWSAWGAPGLVDRTAATHAHGRSATAGHADAVVVAARGAGDETPPRRVANALDGVKAPIAGRWQAPNGATMRVRRRPVAPQEPTRGAVGARRSRCLLGAAAAWVTPLTAMSRNAGGDHLPGAELLGDGAPGIGHVAEAHGPGVRQPLDSDHLRAPRSAVAQLLCAEAPEHPTPWVESPPAACLPDRVGDVRGRRKRLRPFRPAGQQAVTPWLGDVATTRTSLRDQEPWPRGLPVGSGAVAGACKPVVPARFKRAGTRWTTQGFLHVLA